MKGDVQMHYNCVINNPDCDLSQCELMNKIQSYAFAINDLALYLNTHGDDQKALALHNQYAREYRNMVDSYQRKYGPLSMFCPCNSWRWVSNPWPWEGGNN